MMLRSIPRGIFKILMVAGVALIPIGPCARMSNEEGFGNVPGPIAKSLYWQRVSYVLIPTGAVLTLVAGITLIIWDRQSNAAENRRTGETLNSDEKSPS